MTSRLATLAVVLAAAIGAPLVVSAAGIPAPAHKTVAVASVVTPAPVQPIQVAPAQVAPAQAAPVQVAPAQAAVAPAADCGRRVRVVYQGYAPAPVACTASR